MKTKLMLAMAVAVFAGSFGLNSARADDGSCMRACFQQHRLCIQYSSPALCEAFRTQCLHACPDL